MSKNNYYAIAAGGKQHIVTTWAECEKIRNAHPSGAKYKGFVKKEDAEAFLEALHSSSIQTSANTDSVPAKHGEAAIAYTDGSFNKGLQIWGYGVVLYPVGKPEKIQEFSGSGNDAVSTRNVAGEVHGAMRAIEEAIRADYTSIQIFHDYEGVAAWANGLWKANIPLTREYVRFIQQCRKQIAITFVKVTAHTGVVLNERVDILAKKAAKLQ